MASKSVLMCCYYFPPFARSGGMRSLQFGRRLAERGWDVSVLAAAPELYSSSSDAASTAKGYEAPAWARVTHVGLPPGRRNRPHSRAREFSASLLDPWRLEGEMLRFWVDAATEAAEAIVRARPETVLYVGMQPYAAALVGLRLQDRLGTRWIADLADPWTLDEVCGYSSYAHFRRQQSIFRRVLRRASAVLANTPDAAAAIADFEPSVRERMSVVTYGFDRANIPPEQPPPVRPDGRFVLAHLGTVEGVPATALRHNPLRYRPYPSDLLARGAHYLLQALEIVRARRPDVFARLLVRVIASRTAEDVRNVEARGMAAQFEWTGVLPNAAAMAEVARANAALLLQLGMPRRHRLRTVRAKSYEYMAIGRPILACVPEGDGADYVRRYGRGIVCDPSSAEEIARGIERLMDDYEPTARAPVDREFVDGFEWGRLTDRLEAAMLRVTR